MWVTGGLFMELFQVMVKALLNTQEGTHSQISSVLKIVTEPAQKSLSPFTIFTHKPAIFSSGSGANHN